jgi:adenylate cyclase class IV
MPVGDSREPNRPAVSIEANSGQSGEERMSSGDDQPRRNLERKARCRDLAAARDLVESLGARCEGMQVQTDTFFHVSHGRLKLRVVAGQSSTLIGYRREEVGAASRAAPKEAPLGSRGLLDSSYFLTPVPEPETLRALLAAALGVRGEVRKRRTVYHHANVRIHLDEVEGLGTVVELEAVIGPDADEDISRQRLEDLSRMLGLTAADDLPGSNIDLLGM